MRTRSTEIMIAVYGDNCIDRYVGATPTEYVGGNAVNVAVHLADLGARIAYFGTLGDDQEGAQIRKVLKARGIDCSNVQIRHGATAVTWIEVRQGERIVLGDSVGIQCPLILEPDSLRALAGFPFVHLTAFTSWNIHWRSACPKIVDEARALSRAGVRVSLDFSELRDPELAALMRDSVEVAFVSRAEAEMDSALRFFHGCGIPEVVVTMGASGAMYSGSEGRVWVPAISIQPVDTLGAGDAFAAGWLFRRSQGQDARSCMLAGTTLAAQVCGYFGAWPNGRLSEVEDAGTANPGIGAARTYQHEAS